MRSELHVLRTASLGNNSYLLASDGVAAVVDPPRDAGRLFAVAESRGLEIRYVLETHVHNDYLSGALEVRSATGAEIAAPAEGGYGFCHRPMGEGDQIRLGSVRLRAIRTPGHTPEHLAYLVHECDDPAASAVFTGGSLLVGAAGRTDLLGPGRTEELARSQFRSLRRLAGLPDATLVLPTHGAGSLCAASAASGEATSTVGAERRRNPALRSSDEEKFLTDGTSGLAVVPAYYRHMAPLNRAGPAVLGGPAGPAPLSAQEVAERSADGAWVVDGRDRVSFAAGHLPGSVNVELDDGFATLVGSVVPFGASVVLVAPEPEEEAAAEASRQLFRIGNDRVDGFLAGGVRAWLSAGYSLRAYEVADVNQAADAPGARVLDVRQPTEWEGGCIPDSRRVFVGELPARLDEIPRDREIWTICATGRRAAVAASLLDRAGIPVRPVVEGGVADWLAFAAARGKEARR